VGDPVTGEVLADYEKLVSQSLLIWQNVFWEIAHELPEEHKTRALALSEYFRLSRKHWSLQDEQPKDKGTLWNELETACMSLHKMIHSLPNREPLHRQARHIEQLMRDYRLTAKKG